MSHWSFSRLKTFEGCAAKYDYRYNLRLPDLRGPGPAAERGTRIHSEIEASINGTAPAPIEAGFVGNNLDAIRISGITAIPEHEIKLDREWKLAPVDGDYWLHCILDLYTRQDNTTAEIWDWKTGKKYPDHPEQAELYAIASFKAYPELTKVTVKFAYLDLGCIIPKEFGLHHVAPAVERWQNRVGRMESATEFIPKPNFMCRFCGYSKAVGGPCRF